MLARIPFWGWLIVILIACYLVYNPLGLSVWHMWTSGDPTAYLPFKLLGSLVLAVLLGLVLHGTLKSMNWLGLLTMLAVVGVTMWSAHTLIAFDVFAGGMWAWMLQPILAVIFTVGWQWPKIWRRCTGAVSVSDPDTPA
jgi:hypothetical protein